MQSTACWRRRRSARLSHRAEPLPWAVLAAPAAAVALSRRRLTILPVARSIVAASGPALRVLRPAAVPERPTAAAVVTLINRELGDGTRRRQLAFNSRQRRANQLTIRRPRLVLAGVR